MNKDSAKGLKALKACGVLDISRRLKDIGGVIKGVRTSGEGHKSVSDARRPLEFS
jgi:hypothetical protein